VEIFDYDNILLLPRKCRVESRSECDASATLGGRSFKLPVVPANMKTVVDEPITEWLAANGYFYVMHRFDLDNLAYARGMRDKGLFVSISSGVKAADYQVIDRLATEGVGADYITIDVAHGHAIDSYVSVVGVVEPVDQVQQGRLARAVRTDDRDPFAAAHLRLDVVEQRLVSRPSDLDAV